MGKIGEAVTVETVEGVPNLTKAASNLGSIIIASWALSFACGACCGIMFMVAVAMPWLCGLNLW